MGIKAPFSVIWETIKEWVDDNAPRLSAALAYYTLLSVAPLLIIIIAIAGVFFGESAARDQVMSQMQDLVGQQGAQAIQTAISNAHQSPHGTLAVAVGIITLVVGATGAFAELQSAMNAIWDVKPRPGGAAWGFIRKRLLTFGMVLAIGVLLLVSLVVSAALSAIQTYFTNLLPGAATIWQIVNLAVSLLVATLLFGLIYKVLPDVKIRWHDVWIGALVTAILFTAGKFAIGFYLGHASAASSYGAAGSLVVVLIWVYYSAMIFFFGAEFTQVYARRHRPV